MKQEDLQVRELLSEDQLGNAYDSFDELRIWEAYDLPDNEGVKAALESALEEALRQV